MTLTQIKILKYSVMGLVGLSLYQALVISQLQKNLNRGRQQFGKLHDTANYLLDEVIAKNDIELTEFDAIAIASINEDDD